MTNTTKTKTPRLRMHDRVTYRRRDREGKPLSLVRGFVDELSSISCLIFNTASGDLVAASLDRVRKVGA